MSNMAMQTAQLIDMLPETDAMLINELVKKLVRAWDPDFTKVTEEECAVLEQADKEMRNGEYFTDDEVWG